MSNTIQGKIVTLDALGLEDYLSQDAYNNYGHKIYDVVRRYVEIPLMKITNEVLEVVVIGSSENFVEIVSKQMYADYKVKVELVDKLLEDLSADLYEAIMSSQDDMGSKMMLNIDLKLEGIRIPERFVTYAEDAVATV